MNHATIRHNFSGNTEDDDGGSFYVQSQSGQKIAGPFASGPYACEVRERFADRWPDPKVIYDPDPSFRSGRRGMSEANRTSDRPGDSPDSPRGET